MDLISFRFACLHGRHVPAAFHASTNQSELREMRGWDKSLLEQAIERLQPMARDRNIKPESSQVVNDKEN